MADKKFNLKDQLAGIAALIAAIVAIGGGFVKYGEVMTKLEVLEGASKSIDMSFLSEIKVLEEKVAKLESVDTAHEHPVNHDHTKSLVNAKEIELLKVQIEEIKVSTSNPLAD
jgi:hypothetical protein|tara:strand:- start:925 stop:1263 length:339 start_codon:yes stop_codon:yes gene_type:complete